MGGRSRSVPVRADLDRGLHGATAATGIEYLLGESKFHVTKSVVANSGLRTNSAVDLLSSQRDSATALLRRWQRSSLLTLSWLGTELMCEHVYN
jgi:hypothetical protein